MGTTLDGKLYRELSHVWASAQRRRGPILRRL